MATTATTDTAPCLGSPFPQPVMSLLSRTTLLQPETQRYVTIPAAPPVRQPDYRWRENLILETGFLVSPDLCVRLMPDSSDLKSQIDCQSISAWLLILIDYTCNATNKVKYL